MAERGLHCRTLGWRVSLCARVSRQCEMGRDAGCVHALALHMPISATLGTAVRHTPLQGVAVFTEMAWQVHLFVSVMQPMIAGIPLISDAVYAVPGKVQALLPCRSITSTHPSGHHARCESLRPRTSGLFISGAIQWRGGPACMLAATTALLPGLYCKVGQQVFFTFSFLYQTCLSTVSNMFRNQRHHNWL